jgi:hypothetical protein
MRCVRVFQNGAETRITGTVGESYNAIVRVV